MDGLKASLTRTINNLGKKSKVMKVLSLFTFSVQLSKVFIRIFFLSYESMMFDVMSCVVS